MTSVGTGKSLSELERVWFAERTTSSNKLDDMKREYFESKVRVVTDTPHTAISELERRWLCSVIGGNVDENIGLADLWQKACVASSVPVTNYINENKRTFYSTVTTSP